jgi:hypothetical protein
MPYGAPIIHPVADALIISVIGLFVCAWRLKCWFEKFD